MTEIIFNDFGSPEGTKVIGILDVDGFLIDTTVVSEDETEENMLIFAQATPGFSSYVVLTDPTITIGYKREGIYWIAPQKNNGTELLEGWDQELNN